MNWIILKKSLTTTPHKYFDYLSKRSRVNEFIFEIGKILQEDDNDTIFNDLVPEWFQSFIMNLF